MPNQKLLETISCLSKQEKKRLQNFINSSYHNTKFNAQRISLLLERILYAKKGKKNNSDELDKEKLNKEFFPDKPYKLKGKNSIDSLASDLFSLVQSFITNEDFKIDNPKGREYLAMARFYRKNNMEPRFLQTIKQFRNYLVSNPVHDASYFLLLFRLEEEVAIFQSTFNTYTGDSNLIAVNISLDNFYVISKLEFSSALQFQKDLGQFQTDGALRLSRLIIEEFPENDAIQTPLARLNYQIIKMFDTFPDGKTLQRFLEMAISNEANIPADKYRNIMAFYRYFVGKRYQQETSGRELLDRMFVIYKEHLSKGYFHVNEEGHLLPSSLKLMINIALKVGENEWARELLELYPVSKIAGTRFQQEAHSLCLAEVFFFEGNYDKAQEELVYRNFEAINYSILADILLVKIYFMTSNSLVSSRISALSQKIRRSKINIDKKKRYLNFITVFKQIIKLEPNSNVKRRNKVRENLTETAPLIEREWLESIL